MLEYIRSFEWLEIGVKVASIIILCIGVLKWLSWTYKKSVDISSKEDIPKKFTFKIIKAVIIIIALYLICEQFSFMSGFSKYLGTSSSILVAIIGFAAQEALGNVLSGVFISLSKPFNVGDRVKLTSKNITGIVEDINLRHTVIKTFENTRLLVPNSFINTEVLENSNFVDEMVCNFLDVSVSYDTDLDKAIEVIKDLVRHHEYFLDSRTDEDKKQNKDDVVVLVRNLGESGIDLRCNIWTHTVGENFIMCSDLRKAVVNAFREHNIEISYPHVQVINN